MKAILEKYKKALSNEEVTQKVKEIVSNSHTSYKSEILKKIFKLIDLTTLNATDTFDKVKTMCENVNKFNGTFSDMENVAAICVYPALVPVVKENLNVKKINIAAVSGGFPASQTFIKVKVEETKMAVEAGANEIDMVIPVGRFLSGDYQLVFDEVKAMKEACGEAHLKVILETGALPTAQHIKDASVISMEAGADFIKTSTGKFDPPATLDAVFIMTEAIQEYYTKTGKQIGIKPAGGISVGKVAIEYLSIVKYNLGDAWVNPKHFRIGASSLANNLLSEIATLEKGEKQVVKYF